MIQTTPERSIQAGQKFFALGKAKQRLGNPDSMHGQAWANPSNHPRCFLLLLKSCPPPIDSMKTKPRALPSSVVGLSPLELSRKIPVADAAEHNGVHIDTFKKAYAHLLKRVGKRRLMVTVYDMIVLPPPDIARGPPAAR